MVYSLKQPLWHSLTEPSLEPMTAEQILDQRFGQVESVAILLETDNVFVPAVIGMAFTRS